MTPVLGHLLTGAVHSGPVPGPPDAGRLLLHVSPSAGPIIAVVLLAGAYLLGVRVLHERGDAWSPWRTASWLIGLLIVAYAVMGGIEQYDDVLFSAHAVQHMLLATIAPIPLALGAPVTLALRALPGRPRRGLVWVLHTRVAKVLSFPLVGFALLIVSLYGLYFSSLYQDSLQHPLLHELIHLHFLLVGCLFIWPVIGLDPLPHPPYWARLLLLFVTFPMHALFAIALMSTNEVFARSWYESVGRTWGASLLSDQRTGAGIMWAAGELVGAAVFVALFMQWSRADEREARRDDRRLDRADAVAAAAAAASAGGSGPAVESLSSAETEDDLAAREAAYNAWLASLATADERRGTARARRR